MRLSTNQINLLRRVIYFSFTYWRICILNFLVIAHLYLLLKKCRPDRQRSPCFTMLYFYHSCSFLHLSLYLIVFCSFPFIHFCLRALLIFKFKKMQRGDCGGVYLLHSENEELTETMHKDIHLVNIIAYVETKVAVVDCSCKAQELI